MGRMAFPWIFCGLVEGGKEGGEREGMGEQMEGDGGWMEGWREVGREGWREGGRDQRMDGWVDSKCEARQIYFESDVRYLPVFLDYKYCIHLGAIIKLKLAPRVQHSCFF